jgi:two-component system sensor histidine kinase UhpB
MVIEECTVRVSPLDVATLNIATPMVRQNGPSKQPVKRALWRREWRNCRPRRWPSRRLCVRDRPVDDRLKSPPTHKAEKKTYGQIDTKQIKAAEEKTISAPAASAIASLRLSPPPRRKLLDALWHRHSVRAQLLLAVILIDIVAAIVAGGVAIVRARVQTRVETAASMRLAELLVGDVANVVHQDFVHQDLAAEQFLKALPTQLQSMRHVRITVKDATGAAIAAPAATPAERLGGTRADAREPAPAWFAALVASPSETHTVPLAVNGRTIGAVDITGEPADEIAEVWDDAVALGTVAILLNVAMIALLYVLFGRVLDPLTVLVDGLSDLEHQSYDVRLRKPQAPELAAIVEHFNALAAALGTARAENLRLSRQLITAQDDERRRTALELHDEVGPCLFGLKANAASIAGAAAALPDKARQSVTERLHDIRGIVEHLQAINRSMLERLRPMALGHFALTEILDQLVRERARQHADISFAFAADALPRSFGDPVDLTLYRCIQESLTNAIRHAGPKTIAVELRHAGANAPLVLTVRDDGRGIDADSQAGFGTRGMRERVAALGGRTAIESGIGGGTCVRVTIPASEIRNVEIRNVEIQGGDILRGKTKAAKGEAKAAKGEAKAAKGDPA